MNALTLRKEADKLRDIIKTASRALLEFQIAQSEWDIKQGRYKVYSSVNKLMHDVRKAK